MTDNINKSNEWDDSYKNKDNFLFYPHEEIIRFVSKFIRKKTGINDFINVSPNFNEERRILDLGCGIGRHIIYCHDMGLETYGVDLSGVAIKQAREWGVLHGLENVDKTIVQGNSCELPWTDGYFHYIISHGVLDSMPFEMARFTCTEIFRIMSKNGLFYCDLVSGDDSKHAREFSGEEIVSTSHEQGTIQLYFNMTLIEELIHNLFDIVECKLIKHENVIKGGYYSRYHLTLKKQ